MLRQVTVQNVLSVKFSSVVTKITATKCNCWRTTAPTGTLCPYCGMTSNDLINSTALASTLAYAKQKKRGKLYKAAGHFLNRRVCVCVTNGTEQHGYTCSDM
jgi:hypothetical protein